MATKEEITLKVIEQRIEPRILKRSKYAKTKWYQFFAYTFPFYYVFVLLEKLKLVHQRPYRIVHEPAPIVFIDRSVYDLTKKEKQMTKKINYMDIKEFREKGYLQEVNRKFLHPLGLALEIIQNEDGTESLGGIWDYRDNQSGIRYDLENSDQERIDRFRNKAKFISSELGNRLIDRSFHLGFAIEPIPEEG